jgi:tetratricopeptide (TPR) repeat protein
VVLVAALALAAGVARASESAGDAPRAVPAMRPPKKREPGAKPPPLAALAALDPREPSTGEHAPIAAEAKRLDRLLPGMVDDPRHADLLRSAADTFADLAAARIDPIYVQDIPAFRADARRKAIRAYGELRSRYPDRVDDQVIYRLALQYERLGDLRQARALYYDVIMKWPKSKLVPRAYLAFGDMFAAEAQQTADKWPLAQAAYREVLKYPPPANDAADYARYRLAHALWSTGEFAAAMAELAKVVGQLAASGNGSGASKQLGARARQDLVEIYAMIGSPARASAFFRHVNGAANDKQVVAMMHDLGRNYVETGRYGEGITVFGEMARSQRGVMQCLLQVQVAHATLAMPSAGRALIARELDQLLAVRNGLVKSGEGTQRERDLCSNAAGALVIAQAVALHIEAVGADGRPGTNDRDTMAAAAALYGKILASFSTADIDKLDFKQMDDDTRPTAARLTAYREELERRARR